MRIHGGSVHVTSEPGAGTSFSVRLLAGSAHLPEDRIARADAAPRSGERLRQWLASGAHGDMIWMEEKADRRASPAGLWPEVRSIISLGMSYAPGLDPLALALGGGEAFVLAAALPRAADLGGVLHCGRFTPDPAARVRITRDGPRPLAGLAYDHFRGEG